MAASESSHAAGPVLLFPSSSSSPSSARVEAVVVFNICDSYVRRPDHPNPPPVKPSPPAHPSTRLTPFEAEQPNPRKSAAAGGGGGGDEQPLPPRLEWEMGIFEPFRAIGYITAGGVPFSVQRLGTETFVTVTVAKTFHVYNCAKLNLVLAGPQLRKKIRALASYREYTFAAYGSDIAVFKRTDQVVTWSRHEDKVDMLYLFGEYMLSADIRGNIFIWAFRGAEPNSEPVGSISLGDKFTPTCIMHPDTYLNKIIIGSEEGPLQLWNISTKEKLYEFKGWNSSVCCCVSSPALDVVAVGCSDGTIHVHNIRYDEELMSFNHQIRGAVTALSFYDCFGDVLTTKPEQVLLFMDLRTQFVLKSAP